MFQVKSEGFVSIILWPCTHTLALQKSSLLTMKYALVMRDTWSLTIVYLYCSIYVHCNQDFNSLSTKDRTVVDILAPMTYVEHVPELTTQCSSYEHMQTAHYTLWLLLAMTFKLYWGI